MTASLFPEWDERHPAPTRTPPRPWRPTGLQQKVLALLLARGPMSDQAIVMALIGDTTPGKVLDAIETLGRRGRLVDTGERGPWTTRGRSIVWRPA